MHDRFVRHVPEIELYYFGREESACGATALTKRFQEEQRQLIEGAFDSARVERRSSDVSAHQDI